MKISFKDVLLGSCCSICNNSNKTKEYNSLKNFVISKLCIKELLVKFNEIDKFKATLLTNPQLKAFEEVHNPFPVFEGVNSLWKSEEYLNIKNESHKNFREFIQ